MDGKRKNRKKERKKERIKAITNAVLHFLSFVNYDSYSIFLTCESCDTKRRNYFNDDSVIENIHISNIKGSKQQNKNEDEIEQNENHATMIWFPLRKH